MNKGLKVLSAVMALSMGVLAAGVLGANQAQDESKTKPLSKEVLEILAVKEEPKAEKATATFYEGITSGDLYKKLTQTADKEFKALKADTKEWARLSTLACNSAQGVESIDNQLAALEKLLVEAKGLEKIGATKYNKLTDGTVAETELFAGEIVLLAKDAAELKALLKTNKDFAGKTEEQLKATEVKENIFSGTQTTPAMMDAYKKNVEALEALKAKVEAEAYTKAVEYISKYTEAKANETVMGLREERTNLMGIISIVNKIGNDVGLKLSDKCALPRDLDLTNMDKEAQKDKVPNTAAKLEAEPEEAAEVGVYFISLVPTKVEKKAEAPKAEKKAPAFSFNNLQKLELPVVKPVVVAKKVEAPKAAEKKAPAFSFNALQKLQLTK